MIRRALEGKAWSPEKVEDFREWHEGRLREMAYPPNICEELRTAREAWLRQSARP